MRFKQGLVLARCDPSGDLVAHDGRVEIRFREGDARAYQAAPRNLVPVADSVVLPDETCPPAKEPAASRAAPAQRARGGPSRAASSASGKTGFSGATPDGAIVVYADGACSGNPGPAGVGIVLIEGKRRREMSQYLGHATNNIAELTAIQLAAEAIEDVSLPVHMFTDSQYSIGVLQKGWKAKANVELVARVRERLARLADVELRYVPGHAGVPLNERADALAVQAVSDRDSTGWIDVE
jgi:ribonuclease HI